MMKRETPKRVTLLDSRTFVARYRCVTRTHLTANIRLRYPYRQRAAPRGKHQQRAIQPGRGLSSNILKFAKKAVKTPIVPELGKMALNELPNLYNKGTNKIKNKKIKKLLQSDLANTLVDMGTEYGQQKLGQKDFFIKKYHCIFVICLK